MRVRSEMRAGRLCDRIPWHYLDSTGKLVDPRDDKADQG